MIENIVGSFSSLKLWHPVRDDDKIDQLHHFFVVAMLLMMTVFVGTSQLVGEPVNCWVPAEYQTESEHFIDYINNYCWITPMYHVPMNEPIPIDQTERQKTDVGYYRWVMVMFLFEALLFYTPHLIWKTLSNRSAINIKMVVKFTIDAHLESSDKKDREEKLSTAAMFIDKCLKTFEKRDSSTRSSRLWKTFSRTFFYFGTKSGSYLLKLYLVMKVLNLVNVLGQFVLLGAFLHIDYIMYGFRVLFFLSENGYWLDMEHFPRISLCDFQIRQLQNIQDWTVQCVLSINLFLEKLYAFVWFVFAILVVATVINLLSWVSELVTYSRREAFLEKYKYAMGVDSDTLFKRFCRGYLRSDGVFLIRMIERNTTEMVSQDILNLLWVIYLWRNHKLDDWNVSSENELMEKFWKREAEGKKQLITLQNGKHVSRFKNSVDL